MILEKALEGRLSSISAFAEEHVDDFAFAADNVLAAIGRENIMKITRFTKMLIPEDYESLLNNNLNQLIIELTERCNLRCSYCTYNEGCGADRNFGERDISEEDMLRAVNHSGNSEDLSISFYGGEPLIRYDLMKKCVEYAQSKI